MDIYGKVRSIEGSKTFIPFRYQGQYEDEETGLYYNRYRYYSSDTGGYISQDPIGLDGGNPNIYAYAFDSNTEVDPFGLDIIDLSNPSSIWGKSADDIAKEFSDAGYETNVRQSTRGSGNARIVSVKGHSSVAQVQVHAGGGRHSGSYYKISTNDGKIKVLNPETYKHIEGEKIKTYFDKDGKTGSFGSDGKWTTSSHH
ncbi:RHS repeat-associated core domain-containing protein [uncultured Algibacter sp.]|uniref:RHS repeat protein n=1 Tax=uncultured Algibacter sp. TaxID=298659 RepID=UPI0032163F1B